MGIYVIICWATHVVYVGSTERPWHTRRREHICYLRGGKHYNTHLQRAWNKYGESTFEFKTLIEMSSATLEELLAAEDEIINSFWPDVFNTNRHPTMSPSRTPETRAKIRAAMKGREITPEHRAKISSAQKGVPKGPKSAITRQRMSKAMLANPSPGMTGKCHTIESRAKISASLRRHTETA